MLNMITGGAGGAQGAQGARGAGAGGLLKKLFDPLGILPNALNPATHLQMVAKSPLGSLLAPGMGALTGRG